MRYQEFLLSSLLVMPLGSHVLAGMTDCSNAQGTVAYHLNTPDGGAWRPPVEFWMIKGQRYNSGSCESRPGLECTNVPDHTVTASFTNENQLSFKQYGIPHQGNAHFERIYTVHVQVVLTEGEQDLANTDLICQQTGYNGLPRP